MGRVKLETWKWNLDLDHFFRWMTDLLAELEMVAPDVFPQVVGVEKILGALFAPLGARH